MSPVARAAGRGSRRAVFSTAVLLVASTGLGACGGSSSQAGGTTTTQPSVAPAFCEALLDFDSTRDPGPSEIAALVDTAPGPLVPSVKRYTAAVDAGKPEGAVATRNLGLIHAWAHGNCGFQRVDVEVRDDNRFRGIEEELHAGPTSFEVLSHAEEDTTDMVILRRPYDDTTPIYDQLDDYRAGKHTRLRWVAGLTVPPKAVAGTTARLERGDYLVVSLQPDRDEHDEPRYLHGMIAEFTVE